MHRECSGACDWLLSRPILQPLPSHWSLLPSSHWLSLTYLPRHRGLREVITSEGRELRLTPAPSPLIPCPGSFLYPWVPLRC